MRHVRLTRRPDGGRLKSRGWGIAASALAQTSAAIAKYAATRTMPLANAIENS